MAGPSEAVEGVTCMEDRFSTLDLPIECWGIKQSETRKYRDAVCKALNLEFKPIAPDGNCFFGSVCAAMNCLPPGDGQKEDLQELRARTVSWLRRCKDGHHGELGVECNKFMIEELKRPIIFKAGTQRPAPKDIAQYLESSAEDGAWVEGNLDEYLQMIFINPREIVRIAPIGRVAQTFHYEARTVHASMKLHFNVDSWNDDQFVDYLNDQNVFSNMKVLIGLEMFMMTDCVLSGLLKYVKKHRPHTLVLFEGDPIQLSIFKDLQCPVLCSQEFDSMFRSVVFNTQKRISNEEQSNHLDNMRISKAGADTLAYWQSKIDLHQNWDKSCLTIYALSKQANRHNEKMLQEHETSTKVMRCRIDSIDTRHGKKTTFPDFVETSCIAEHVLCLVPNAPVFINRNLTAKLHGSSKDTYVGNGTPATCLEMSNFFIVLRLVSGEVVSVERISFELDDGYERKQFPLILGWASSIHKVQGMQFPKVIVDFCLDAAGPSAIRDSNRPFRQGMAYMALSRSNCIAIQGHITLELLNNVNQIALDYWIRKVQEWPSTGDSTKKIYRDGIHAHNDFCLQQQQHAQQSAKRHNIAPPPDLTHLRCVTPPVLADIADIFIDDVPAPDLHPALALAPVSDSALEAAAPSPPILSKRTRSHFPVHASPSLVLASVSSIGARLRARARDSATATDPADDDAPHSSKNPFDTPVAAQLCCQAVLNVQHKVPLYFNGSVLAPAPVTPAAGCQQEGAVVDNDDATSPGQKQRRDESLLLMRRKRRGDAPASDSLQRFAQAPTPVTAPSQCIQIQGTRNKPKHTKVVSPITWLLQACLDVGLISQTHASQYSDPEEIIARWPRDKGYATKERFKTRGGITEAEFWPKVLERYPQSKSSGVFTDFGSEYFFQGFLCALLGDFQEVIGIELDEESFEKSVELAKYLVNKAETENKLISNVMLIRGDFLKHDAVANIIARSTIIYANNVVFGHETNIALSTMWRNSLPADAVIVVFDETAMLSSGQDRSRLDLISTSEERHFLKNRILVRPLGPNF
jgi:hypothetical protein